MGEEAQLECGWGGAYSCFSIAIRSLRSEDCGPRPSFYADAVSDIPYDSNGNVSLGLEWSMDLWCEPI